jgi:hypothetical protein
MEFLAWPVVALILGLVGMFSFKKPFERLIDRTQKVSKAGIEAGQAIQQTAEQKPVSTADELLKDFDNALVLKREAEIRQMLDNAKLPSGGDRERVLIRYLAGASLIMTFETVYSRIWGGQIGLLEYLNSAGSEGVAVPVLRSFFDGGAAREPSMYAGDTFERWLGFLESFSLILRRGESMSITLEGREFLKYIIQQGYSIYKRG